MGFLTRGAGLPDHSKAIISLWFRVPQASIDAAKAAGDDFGDYTGAPRILPWVIPLMTFGRQQTLKQYGGELVDINNWIYAPNPPTVEHPNLRVVSPTVVRTDPVSPSYIGLNCSSGSAKLEFNLQTEIYAREEGGPGRIVSVDIWGGSFPGNLTNTAPPGYVPIGAGELSPADGSAWTTTDSGINDNGYFHWFFDDTWYPDQPEKFLVQSPTTLVADQWHHLLLSYDFSSDVSTHSSTTLNVPFDTISQGTTSSASLWYSIDDVNKSGVDNLGPFFVEGGGDANAILTASAYDCTEECKGLGEGNVYFGVLTYDLTPGPLPTSGAAFGIPASSGYQGHIYDVDMGEGQIFLGITLDTAVEANRRLFVTLDGKPEVMAVAAQALGQQPHIKLHSQKNWLVGKNTGSLGGVLTRTATVNPFLPAPGLGT